MGKSMDFLRANLINLPLVPDTGAGNVISTTISSSSSTVVLVPFTIKNFSASITRLVVWILAFKAIKAGAMSDGLTAIHPQLKHRFASASMALILRPPASSTSRLRTLWLTGNSGVIIRCVFTR
jgi:hypothetical protein